MKNLSFLLVLLFLASCDNELQVLEDAKDIPVVYGFLSLNEEDQYIRVERAFVDQNTPALELAQNPDNLYYPASATVSITDLVTNEEFLLERVDASQIGFPREDGLFATDPNILYKLSGTQTIIDQDHTYQFTLNRGDGLPLVTDTTEIVSNVRFISPNPLQATPMLSFAGPRTTEFQWRQGDNGVIYDLFLEFKYQERTSSTSYEDRSVKWKMAEGITLQQFSPSGFDFYSFLRGAIEENSEMTRRFIDIKATVVAGNQDLLEYLRISRANLGITSTQDVPFFQDLSEGRGIFGSTFSATLEGIKLSDESRDSLANGSITELLNFQF